ncbi:MAG: hypothetical protein RIG61_04610 [Deltaproteobacteria bacterium]
MSKLLLSTIMASGLMLTGGNLYAGSTDHDQDSKTHAEETMKQDSDMKEMKDHGNYKGEVTAIDGDKVTIKDKEGMEHTVVITSYQDLQELQAETLETGDRVMVLSRDGKPYAISKTAEAWTVDIDAPDFDPTGTTSVKGRVTEVDGDTITIKDKDGVVHTAEITGFQSMEELQTETIEEGDIIVVNMRDGKPYGIGKHLESWLVDDQDDEYDETNHSKPQTKVEE